MNINKYRLMIKAIELGNLTKAASELGYTQSGASPQIKSVEEELGIKAEPEQLHFMGLHEGKCEEIFYGKPFKNHEISHVYLYSEPINIKELKLQEEEVQEVCWMDFETCCEKVKSGDKKYCLFPEELKMIKEYLKI